MHHQVYQYTKEKQFSLAGEGDDGRGTKDEKDLRGAKKKPGLRESALGEWNPVRGAFRGGG